MATLKIEPGTNGRVWVSFTRFSDVEIARDGTTLARCFSQRIMDVPSKEIPGKQWNPERKQWSLPDTPETRKVLAEIVAMPPSPPPKMIAVRPKSPHPMAQQLNGASRRPNDAPSPPPSPSTGDRGGGEMRRAETSGRQGRGRYVPGRDKPLTTNPPHPFIKQVDDELVLRGMAASVARGKVTDNICGITLIG